MGNKHLLSSSEVSYEYDSEGMLTGVTDVDGQTTTFTYDSSTKRVILGEFHDNGKKWIDLIAKYKDLQELDAPIINELCEKILIHESEKIDGKRTQRIEIFDRFVGNLQITCDN